MEEKGRRKGEGEERGGEEEERKGGGEARVRGEERRESRWRGGSVRQGRRKQSLDGEGRGKKGE